MSQTPGEAAKKTLYKYLDRALEGESIFKAPDGVQEWSNWTVRLRVQKHELNGSFSIFVFLGEAPEDPKQWSTSENLAGESHVFANANPRRYGNHQRRDGDNVIHESFVHLNRHLTRILPHAPSFDPEVVEPYLTENLNWRVLDIAQQPVEIQSLHVVVFSQVFSRKPDDELPTIGERREHPGITARHHGGAHGSD